MLEKGKDDREDTLSKHMDPLSDELTTAEIAEMWMEDIYRKGDWTAIDRLHDNDFLDHSAAGRESGNDGYKNGVIYLYRAFPDFHAITEDMIVEETRSKDSGPGCCGKVVIRWSGSGTHQGEFLGFGATAKNITFRGIEILMITNGKITDRWGEWDGLDLLDQLGGEVNND